MSRSRQSGGFASQGNDDYVQKEEFLNKRQEEVSRLEHKIEENSRLNLLREEQKSEIKRLKTVLTATRVALANKLQEIRKFVSEQRQRIDAQTEESIHVLSDKASEGCKTLVFERVEKVLKENESLHKSIKKIANNIGQLKKRKLFLQEKLTNLKQKSLYAAHETTQTLHTMTNVPNEDESEPKLTCQVCCNNPHKYTCPRCLYKTCSISCCLEHKAKFGCSGVRDTTVLCTKHEYDAFNFQQDYRLLEDIDRKNISREMQLHKFSRKVRAKQRGRKALLKAATEAGLSLRLSDSGILSRAKSNHTHLLVKSGSSQEISWSIEFNLLPRSCFPKGTNLSKLKPLRLVLHNCCEQLRLENLWTDRLVSINSVEQDALITYRPAGSPPFGVVTTWLHTRLHPSAEVRYFFYVQTECPVISGTGKPTTRYFEPVEVFPTSRLYKILRTPDLIIHEMPTVWVSRGELTSTV